MRNPIFSIMENQNRINNQMNQSNYPNYMGQNNQMNQTNPFNFQNNINQNNQLNQTNQLNSQNYINQNNEMNQINQFNSQNNTNQSNQMSQMNRFASKKKNTVDKMVDLFRNNPELYEQFDQMIKKDNNNYKKKFSDDKYLKAASEGKIPRRIFKQNKENNKTYYDETNDNFSIQINIKFQFSSGNIINMAVSPTMKVKDLFISFIKRIGFKEDILTKEIYFLFAGLTIDINEEKTLKEKNLGNNNIILVLDTKGIIGAKSLNLFIKHI